ncbi:putative ribonuclease H-like domain-containing protein [Tanacetum coccineum]
MKFNNMDAARFDKKKVKCYKCSELGHFARECTGKQLDSKARYSTFKLKELDKSEEPKALFNNVGMIAGDDDNAVKLLVKFSDAAAEFALMGYLLRFVKAVGMHVVPSPITGTFIPHSNNDKFPQTQDHWLLHHVFQCKSQLQDHEPLSLMPLVQAAYVPAGRRNPPSSISAGSAFPAGSRNRPALIYWPGCYNQLYRIRSGWLSVSSGGARVPTGSFTGSYWLTTSYWYALTHGPIIFDSLVKQFWSTASLRAPELGHPAILATIDRTPYTITEDTVRSQLQLGDDGGIVDLPIADIYLGMDNLGYPTEGKLTFYKNKFSPQWRFLVHTIQHCLSTKTGSWDQFGSPLAIALICLSDGRRFNWSSYIFKGMVHNISNAKRFLMYPRFLQIILGIETRNTKQHHVLKLSSKLFANMRLNFEGGHMPLLAAMLPPAQAAIADEGTGEVAPDVPHTIPETIQETRPEPDHSQEHLPTPPRPTTSDQIPPVFEQGHTLDPNIASFLGAHASDPDLFTSTNVEDETLGESFHNTPPRSTQVPPEGPTSGGAEDLATLTALSSLVSDLVQKVSTLESELKAHKLLFADVVPKLVKKVKALEVKLKTKKRKVVLSDSDQEDGGKPDVDLDALNALANAAVTVDSTKSPGGPSKNPAACSYDPTSDVPSTEFPTDVPSDGAPTGPSIVSPGSTTVPSSSSVPVAAIIPASSGTTLDTPSSPVRDARKGKDANLARQMSQDFELTEDQRKRQQEVLASAANYSDDAWDIILARLQANPDLSSKIFGVEFTDDDFAARMVELVNTRRKELSEQRAQERREKPMTPSQLRQYMRTYVKNQGPAVYSTDGSPMTSASSEKFKTGDDEVNVEAPSHGVPQEEADAHVEVPSQKATIEDVEVPSNFASTAQHTASSLKKVGIKKKRLGRKGVHTSPSTIPIEDGDPEAEHKVCLKYAFDADFAYDDDTPVNLYVVVDWELLPTGLGSINVFYRLDNSRKYFTSLREILHLGDLKVLMDSPEVNDVSGLVLHMFVDKKYPLSVSLIERMLDHQLEICRETVGNKLTTAVQLIAFLKKQISDSKRPNVHDWYCCYNKEWLVQEGTALGKDYIKSIDGCDDLPKIIRLASLRANGYLVKASSNPLLFFDSPLPGVNTPWDVMRIVSPSASIGFMFLLLLDVVLAGAHSQVSTLKLTSEDLSRNLKYVVPTGRVKVPAGRYVVPTGKDNVRLEFQNVGTILAGY